ncbi:MULTISPECIES: FxSxx-COOH system tetratricopeptide repeat protein [Streptomyces]|uniref:FxSxx-COOH system tetratricopeptide repeat protein n=1 Tax=Streptomyces TaxID=1883 RepID=UPI0002E3F098|nr:FxSxx-COOH system tetratricopeptide repeat protein [Streptomyces sp. AA0539]
MAGLRRTTPAERQRITISFAGFNRPWAAWIADRLEQHGCDVALQRWDPATEIPLVEALSDLLLTEGRVLVILSDWYFQMGPRSTEEWNQALRAVVAPNQRRFAAVSVTSAALPPAVAAFGGAAELWGVGAREAHRRLSHLLGLDGREADSSTTVGLRSGARFPYDQPRVWGGVPRRNIRFTGRETTLQTVYQRLSEADPGTAVVTLLGMSGVGKTQAAAEYVHRFGSAYDVVWWVPADTRGTLRQRLAELAPALGLTTGIEYGERLRAVRDALRRGDPYARWLLVLDGADDPGAIADLVPTGTGHVLITSQNREWGEHNTTLWEVPVYDRDESIAFVRRRARRISTTEADALAEALEDLPLALDQTAGALSDSPMPVTEYIELLRSGADIEMGLRVSTAFPMTYLTAFSIVLNRLRETEPAAVDLLRLCAWFAPGPVPLRLLRDVPARDLPERLAHLIDNPLLWNAALSKLVQYSVIRPDDPGDGDGEGGGRHGQDGPVPDTETIHLHRMVHQAVRAGMSEADSDTFSRVVRRALAAADPRRPDDTRLWSRYAELVPHLEASGALRSTHPETRRLVFNSLTYLYRSGEYRAGIQLAEAADAAWREVYGEDDPLLWELASQHTTLLRAVGEYTRTERMNREIIDKLGAVRGPKDLVVVRAHGGLAADLRGLGRYEEALLQDRRALELYQELVGDGDVRTLNTRNNIAVTLRLLGRYAEALELDRKTLEMRREVLRSRNPWTLSSELSCALDLRLLGRYEEALSLQERNVESHRLVLGPDNPRTLTTELNLALCQHRTGDRAGSRALLARLLERTEAVLGEEAPLHLKVATDFSFVHRETGDLDQAREIGEFALGSYRRLLGDRHPYTIGAGANHALVLRVVGERREAQWLIERSLEEMTAVLGPDHPWTLGIALNTAVGRNLEDDLERAAELSRDTVRRAAAALGHEHPLTLTCQLALASDLRGLRHRQEADQVEEAALNGLIASLGTHHTHTVAARSRSRVHWDFEPLLP